MDAVMQGTSCSGPATHHAPYFSTKAEARETWLSLPRNTADQASSRTESRSFGSETTRPSLPLRCWTEAWAVGLSIRKTSRVCPLRVPSRSLR
eukprot:13418435-Alexandrium_andersonii.AAC.1